MVKRAIILGSGTSTGVPVIGCHCSVCRSEDMRNKRTRASLAICDHKGRYLVIDTGPDFRQQVLAHNIETLQHVCYTHTHADHCHGFDDLRAYYFHQKNPVNLYLAADHLQEIRERFNYAFMDTGYRGTVPQVELHEIIPGSPFEVYDWTIEPIALAHGPVTTTGFRMGSFAYVTDFKQFSDQQIESWRGKIDVMVASGVHWRAHETHSTILETQELFRRLEVKRGIVTHLSHEVEYLKDSRRLLPNYELAYDGMVIDVA